VQSTPMSTISSPPPFILQKYNSQRKLQPHDMI
jgi:hypothetical protein